MCSVAPRLSNCSLYTVAWGGVQVSVQAEPCLSAASLKLVTKGGVGEKRERSQGKASLPARECLCTECLHCGLSWATSGIPSVCVLK